MKETAKFYQTGLRFECTCCGDCCRTPGGKVSLDESEVERICQYLKIGIEEFMESYGKQNNTEFLLKDNFNSGCCFLENNQCQIYPVRPLQCRTFPFWPENLKSHYRWKQLIPLCPGIGKGDLYDAAWIRHILKIQKMADN